MDCDILEKFSDNMSRVLPRQATYDRIIICLSGGSDSVALLILMIEWRKRQQKIAQDAIVPQIIALTIDHKLRPESTLETIEISGFCNNLGIEHYVLEWNHPPLSSAIQKKARDARYELITNWCKDNKCYVALTAHILEDQLEQVLISLSRGSGIYRYLIPEESLMNDVLFLRPMLGFAKETLRQYLSLKQIFWWEDSSNYSPKYLRNQIRPIATALLKISDVKRICTSFENIKRISTSLQEQVFDILYKYFEFNNLGYGIIKIAIYRAQSEEIRLSLLKKILEIIGKKKGDLRLHSVKTLDTAIINYKIKTCFGCKIMPTDCLGGGVVYFLREFGKDTIEDLENDGIWDNRFKFDNLKYCSVKRIYKNTLDELIKNTPELLNFDNKIPHNIKKTILLTLPGIFALEKLVAIPHIYDCKTDEVAIEFVCKLLR